MTDVAILVPVLERPKRAKPLVDTVRQTTVLDWRLVFLCSPRDRLEIQAAQRLARADERISVIVLDDGPGQGDYARKINRGFSETESTWIFQAADDLRFRSGWDTAAVTVGEREAVGVVGTNDLGNPLVMRGQASTHSLIRRAYVDECGGSGQPGVVLHEGYWHNFVDDELVGVARARGCFAFAVHSHVEHLHPVWRKASPDATYERGGVHYNLDRRLHNSRRRYWERARRRNGPLL